MNEPPQMPDRNESLLAIDVGNSTTSLGIANLQSLTIGLTWRLSTQSDLTTDEWLARISTLFADARLRPDGLSGIVISSVVPAATSPIASAVKEWSALQPHLVTASSDLGISLNVDRPHEVGTDRLVNAVAAYHLCKSAVIIVDAGTATKIDAVSRDGAFLGGVIAPGMGIGLEALAARAAQLSPVELTASSRAIGRNTTEAMQSGVVLGHLAMIDGMVARIRRELGSDAPVILTGGQAPVLMTDRSVMFNRYEPHLTLVGAARVWKRTAGRSPTSDGWLPGSSTSL